VKSNLTSLLMVVLGLLPTVLIGVPVSAADSRTTETLTLEQYFAAALKRSEVVANQTELIRQAEERYNQSNSSLLPTVNGVATYTWQDPQPAGELDSSVSPNRQRLVKITATQPLFRGFREFAGLRQNKALLGAQNEDYLVARTQLFKDVAQNFYNVLSIEQDLKNLDEEISQDSAREKELNDRMRIGRSRVGETLTIQSAISTLRAQIEQLRGQLNATREAFAFLSGLDAATPLRDTEILPATMEPVDAYLARLELRPDVKASKQRLAATQENISVVKGAHLPSLDLNANRYLERSGNQKDVAWDVQLALTIPIFTGGLTQSKVREATSLNTQAELSVSQISRQAEQEIRSLYQSVLFDQYQLEALERATDAAKKNYQAQLRDYRLGLVTNLDVLQALTTFQENQRALDRARFSTKLDYLKLQAAAVRRPALPDGSTP